MRRFVFKFHLLLAAILFCSTTMQGQTFNLDKVTVRTAMMQLKKQSGYAFVYKVGDLDTSRIVSINADDLEDAIDQILSGQDLSYEIQGKNIVLQKTSFVPSSSPQNRVLAGMIVDGSGAPVISATVMEQGTDNGVITDASGSFTIQIRTGAFVVVSCLGYQDQIIAVKDQAFLKVVLHDDMESLEGVVVTALGIKRSEKALGYSVQKLGRDEISIVKPVYVATALTGKISGLNVMNSTEFNTAPSIKLRGETPLLVVDGVPYANITLDNISADDIESVDVLKGATASALYGSKGGNGAIMITTRKGGAEGMIIQVSNSTMFNVGYLKMPKVQSSYSFGNGGKYNLSLYVWGDKMDIGRMATQWDPMMHEWREQPLVSKGKDNLKNFMQLSLVTNTNINVSQRGKYGSIRGSASYVHSKGQYPNQKLNKFTYSLSGDINWKGFIFEGGLTWNKRFYPNDTGAGYGTGNFLYNIVVWTGTEYDIRDYKDYWVKKNEEVNWFDHSWYDNPYFIAYEMLHSSNDTIVNGYGNAGCSLTSWLKFNVRTGIDSFNRRGEWRNPVGASGGNGSHRGWYKEELWEGFSLNLDGILTADKSFGNFKIEAMAGSSLSYTLDDWMDSETTNGLTIPGYYSLKASVDAILATSAYRQKQMNSLYGKISLSWKNLAFLDITARNDWSSTLPQTTRSYFYPSIAGSLILSEIIPLPDILDFWKVRASWTRTKMDLEIYDTNKAYSVSTNLFNGGKAAYYPSSMRGLTIKPSARDTWETGTAIHLFDSRLKADLTYYSSLRYNQTIEAPVSTTSGFKSSLINMEEELHRSGVEISLSGDVVRGKEWRWNSGINWSRDRYKYAKVDPVYSIRKPWVTEGERCDWFAAKDYERDPEGNIIHQGGYPVVSNYEKRFGFSGPDWVWGWSNTVSWKKLSLYISCDGRVGGVAHSYTDQAMWNSGTHIDSDNQWRYDEVVNGLKNYVGKGVKVVSGSADYDADGNITRDDRIFTPNDVQVSYEAYMSNINPYIGTVRAQNILDQTFFKLRELSLTYSIPETLCQKLHLKGVSLSFVGQNIFIWAKEFRFADPDVSYDNMNSPSCRYLGFNASLTF